MMTIRPLLTLFGCALAVLFWFACAKDRNPTEDEGAAPVTLTFELGAECSDGLDNDEDGYADCCDPGCKVETVCQPDGSAENTVETCSDCIDNDENGYEDCNDYSCIRTSYGATQEAIDYCELFLENTDEKCQDGEDNDNNGYTDCEDFGCSRNPDVTICPIENTYEECSDGKDNDVDGDFDCDDSSCTRTDDGATQEAIDYCDLFRENTDEKCSDGLDNDEDGFIDCEDFNCFQSTSVTVCP